jgi:hypothetical protein
MRMTVVMTAMAVLLGCGGGVGEPAAQAEPADRETVFEPMIGTMDRARGVEDTLNASEQARRRQIELSEGL